MKVLFDNNLSPSLVSILKDYFPSSNHLVDLELEKASDKMIWDYAHANNCLIVTKDNDFNALASIYSFPPKIIWIKRGNCSTSSIASIIMHNISIINDFILDETNAVLILE